MALEAPAQPPDIGAADMSDVAAPPGSVASRPKATRVVSSETTVRHRLADVWRARELLVYLVRTEIKVRYKNSFLGLLWSMVSPALTLLVFTIVFGVVLKNGIPNFVIFLFAGLLLWNFFSTGVLAATGVVVHNAGLVKKVSFPREILALAAIGSAGVFLFFQSCVLVLFMVILQSTPAWSLLWLVLVALVPTIVFAAAVGLFLSSVNVYFRDTQHLATVLVGSAWFWACPIVYSYQRTLAPHLHHFWEQAIYFLNPLTPPVMTFQRVLYNRMGLVALTSPPGAKTQLLPGWGPLTYLWADAAVLGGSLVLFYLAMRVFARLAGNFAEEL